MGAFSKGFGSSADLPRFLLLICCRLLASVLWDNSGSVRVFVEGRRFVYFSACFLWTLRFLRALGVLAMGLYDALRWERPVLSLAFLLTFLFLWLRPQFLPATFLLLLVGHIRCRLPLAAFWSLFI